MAINFTNFSDKTLDEAIAWISRLRSDQVSDADQADFALWLDASPEHQLAFDEAMLLWESMGVASSSMSIPTTNSPEDISAYLSKNPRSEELSASNDSHPQTSDEIKPNTVKARDSRFKRMGWLTAAASIFIAGFIFLTDGTSQPSSRLDSTITQQLFATPIGTKQRFTLSDGSVIELNTNSRLTVQYSDNQRKLALLEGEAYFDVAHNSERPFVVTANSGVVTAVGTAFNINLQDASMTVSVTDGLIRVNKLDDDRTTVGQAPSEEILVDVGYQLSVNTENIGEKQIADIERIIAWREKTLIFQDMDLSLALSELNRYLKKPVDTSHDSLHKLRISGTFSLEEPEATLDAIIASFELQAYKSPLNDKTRLFRKPL
ncbi:MAG: FecR family protein [Cellvibrionaceae bacterium]